MASLCESGGVGSGGGGAGPAGGDEGRRASEGDDAAQLPAAWPPSRTWMLANVFPRACQEHVEEGGCGAGGESFVVTTSAVGGGFVAELLRARLACAECGPDATLGSLVIKNAPVLPGEGELGIIGDFLRKSGLHAREVTFYKEFGATLAAQRVVPRSPLALLVRGMEGAQDAGCIVMEDLGDEATVAPLGEGMSEDHLSMCMTSLARVHASTWSVDRSRKELAAMDLSDRSEMIQSALRALMAGGIDPFFEAIGPEGISCVGKDEWDRVETVIRELCLGSAAGGKPVMNCPDVVSHGDLWCGNVLVAADTAFLVDWQFACIGNPTADIAMLLASSAPARVRRDCTAKLLATYVAVVNQVLGAAGREGVSIESVEADMRHCMITDGLALVIGSFDTWYSSADEDARSSLCERWAALCIDVAASTTG